MRAGGTDRIRLAVPGDLEAVVSLAGQLWPGHAPGELQEELEPLLLSDEAAFALVFDDNSRPAGFAQCQLATIMWKAPPAALQLIWRAFLYGRTAAAGDSRGSCKGPVRTGRATSRKRAV